MTDLPPERISVQQLRAELEKLPGMKDALDRCNPIKDYIAKCEQDPTRKAALDRARTRMRERRARGEFKLAITPLDFTEDGALVEVGPTKIIELK